MVVGGKTIDADLGVLEKEYAREEKAVVEDGGSRPNGHSAANGNSATNVRQDVRNRLRRANVWDTQNPIVLHANLNAHSQTSRAVNSSAANENAALNVADCLSIKTTSLWIMTTRWLHSETPTSITGGN